MSATAPPSRAPLALGIDLGGTKILAGVVNADGVVVGRGKLKTPYQGGRDELSAALVAAADGALAEAGATREDVRSIGVGAPGPVDSSLGVLLRAVNLTVEGFSVKDALSTAFPGAPLVLENDVRVAALGEARLGAGRSARLVVAIWVGTGIGGAVVLDGKVWTGRNRNAGEIGHSQIDLRRAVPGRPDGTLEGIGSKTGMARFLRRRIERGEKTVLEEAVLRKGTRLKTSEIVRAVAAGDALAVRAVERSARAVGVVVANVWNLLSPDLFVIGGGVGTDLAERYVGLVRETARAFAFTTELGSVEVVPASLGDDAGILGAALLSRDAAV